MSNRLARVASELQKELSQLILYELKDPRIGFVTITKVEPTADLQFAKVFVSVLGDKKKQKESIDCLNRAKGYIHKTVTGRMRMRALPAFSFHFDKTIEEQIRIEELFDKITEKPQTEGTNKR